MCQIGDQYTRSIIQAHLRQRRSDRIGIAEDAPELINRVAQPDRSELTRAENPPASKRKLLEPLTWEWPGGLTLRHAGSMTQYNPCLSGKPEMQLAEGDHRTPDTVDIHRSLAPRASRGWSGSTLSFGTQISDSLYERRVGGKVIPRDADALDPVCEFLQKALPSQCVAASGSDQSHGEGIRLQFVLAGVGAA